MKWIGKSTYEYKIYEDISEESILTKICGTEYVGIAVMLLTYNQEVLGLNLSWDIIWGGFHGFIQSLQANARTVHWLGHDRFQTWWQVGVRWVTAVCFFQFWDTVVSDGGIIEKWCIGKDVEGNGCGLIEVLSWHLLREAAENHKEPQSG
jgi:hypothetical protein